MTIRVINIKKNIIYSYLASFLLLVLNLISRYFFINHLGLSYLGVNGLFTDVLSILSFAELGIGSAMNFALYKPVAENDKEKTKSLMKFYKRAYYVIAIVILIIGLAILPFLKYFVKDPGNIGDIRIYYLIYLYNSVITYFVSYKYSLVNAYQKNYLLTIIDAIVSSVVAICQIISIILFNNFLVYLLIQSAIYTLRIFFVSQYLNRKYPLLKEKDVKPLDKKEHDNISTNVKALVLHKVGEICISQTDSIIISYAIDLIAVALVSTYRMIIVTISNYIAMLFKAVVPSLGNVVAIENEDTRTNVFDIYNFVDFWIYGFSAIAFYFLLSPTVELLYGKEVLIGNNIVLFLCISVYLNGQLFAYSSFKSSYGLFDDDKFVVIISAVINLVVSIYLVKTIGLVGVYVGTVVSTLFQNIAKPIIAHKKITNQKTSSYFLTFSKYIVSTIIAGLIVAFVFNFLPSEITVVWYLVRIVLVTVIPNLVFFVIYGRTKLFKYVEDTLIEQFPILKRILRR